VVGCVGADVPVELLTAAGMLAVRLAGDPAADRGAGDSYLGRGLDPVARSVLSRLLAGDFGRLDALVVSRDCEASLRLFYAVRELRRLEPGLGLPPVHLVDVLHLPHRTTTRYVLAKVREMRAAVGRWAGAPVTDDALAAAIAAHDRLRGLLAALTGLRRARPARLSGTRALAVAAATTAVPVPDAIDLVSAVLAADLPEIGGRRTFLTGSSHDCPHVYAALEGAGLLVVGDDHDWGDLLGEGPVGAPTELALAERYQHAGPTGPRGSIRRRAAYTAAAALACDAELLVAYVREHDDGPPWDFPAQREATGLPAVLLDRQPYGEVELSRLPAAVGAR
jgi:benzoyl-CoA reductase/2-hydroxyglutaryl-CoA dehydratase subunit BcrC/BadD/HgdB